MKLRRTNCSFLLSSIVALGLSAQTTPDVTTMGSYIVTGVPIEDSINPLARTSDAVMGDERDPLSTPRAVSTITSGLFHERQINGVQEILLYSPSAYVGAAYGNITTPNIRGDIAETYLNGQRLSYNYYGTFPSFNGVEAVDLVRGPGSVVFGAGYFTGGYVNYVSKAPSFSTPSTVVTARLGTWAPGQVSYRNGSVQFDTTGPLEEKLAWRLSYEAKGGDTFFRKNNASDDRQDIYFALSQRPDSTSHIDFTAQYFWQNAPETLGVNRVNQELVDHSTYYTGLSSDNASGPGPIPATTAAKLPWEATLFSKGDFSNANVVRSQLVVSEELSPDVTFINRSLFEYVNRRRFQEFEYAEYLTQYTFENRSEAHFDWSRATISQSAIIGATVRYAHTVSYENYFNEYIYNFDVTDASREFNEAQKFPNSYYEGNIGPGGRPFFSAADGSPETDDSTLWNFAAFWQHELKFTPALSLLLGARGELSHARAHDPLPDAGAIAWHDSASVGNFSPSANLLYHLNSQASVYATYQRIRSVAGNLAGGGISLVERSDGTGGIDRDDLRNRSDLAEIGAKGSLLDRKLYTAAAVFDQERTKVSQGDHHSDIRIQGIELESVYQPNAFFSATTNVTLQDGHYVNSAPFQLGGRDIYAAYALGRGPGGRGTGTAKYDPFGNQVPLGNWGLVGFSHTMVNGSIRSRLIGGFGVGLTGQWQSRQKGNLDDQWHIPSQILWNGSLFYETKKWSANLDLLNLTDQKNWIHNGDAYTASELIFPELPFRLEGYVKFKF